MIPRVLVILQNAWRTNGESFTNSEWLTALWESYTGKRLRSMLPNSYYHLHIINSSNNVGTEASSVFPADIQHIKNQINFISPDIIVACGIIAKEAMDTIGLDYIAAPHPAWRALSKQHTLELRKEIEDALIRVKGEKAVKL